MPLVIPQICAPNRSFSSPELCHNQTDPLPAEIIRRAIEIGNPTGTLTFAQLNDLVQSDLEAEDIEALFSALSEKGIQMVEE
jgi:hypothetical protein